MVDTTVSSSLHYLKFTIFSIDHGDVCALVFSKRYGIASVPQQDDHVSLVTSAPQVEFFSGREAMYSFLKEFGSHDAPIDFSENEKRISELLNRLLAPRFEMSYAITGRT